MLEVVELTRWIWRTSRMVNPKLEEISRRIIKWRIQTKPSERHWNSNTTRRNKIVGHSNSERQISTTGDIRNTNAKIRQNVFRQQLRISTKTQGPPSPIKSMSKRKRRLHNYCWHRLGEVLWRSKPPSIDVDVRYKNWRQKGTETDKFISKSRNIFRRNGKVNV